MNNSKQVTKMTARSLHSQHSVEYTANWTKTDMFANDLTKVNNEPMAQPWVCLLLLLLFLVFILSSLFVLFCLVEVSSPTDLCGVVHG